jgi:ferrous iron transport protein B
MIFALAGNQNCGKTTLFNQLTGSNQHVGNFPGVTVERKDGIIRGHKDATVVDLPGIYSLSPYTSEEIVTRDFILNKHPDGIINIVDATNIERNLYLTMQLIELDLPMVVCLNMMDEVRNNGGTIHIEELSKELGVPVIPISASKNEGIDELIDILMETAQNKNKPMRQDFCSGPVHRCIHAVAHLIEDHAQRIGVPAYFAATKLVEGDTPMMTALALNENEIDMLGHSVKEMERDMNTDREAAMADMRYTFIEKLCRNTVVKPKESREHRRSVRIDAVLTNKYAAIPIFLCIMFLIFWLTFVVIGAALSDLLTLGIDAVTNAATNGLQAYGINPVVQSLIISGVFFRRGQCAFLPAYDCGAVFLPVYFGGQRLHGTCCVCDG